MERMRRHLEENVSGRCSPYTSHMSIYGDIIALAGKYPLFIDRMYPYKERVSIK